MTGASSVRYYYDNALITVIKSLTANKLCSNVKDAATSKNNRGPFYREPLSFTGVATLLAECVMLRIQYLTSRRNCKIPVHGKCGFSDIQRYSFRWVCPTFRSRMILMGSVNPWSHTAQQWSEPEVVDLPLCGRCGFRGRRPENMRFPVSERFTAFD